jgi:Tol biopolymer transport system component
LAILGLTLGLHAPVSAQAPPPIQVVKPLAIGGRVDWSAVTRQVAFDKRGDDGFSDVWVMWPNATGKTCLTCGKPLPQSHNGNPSWHPSGNHIVFQCQDPSLPVIPEERQAVANFVTAPGWGTNNNLWLMTADGSRFWPLTTIAAGMATLHPQFSHSGNRLAWAERVGFEGSSELWVMRLAEFVWNDDTPALANVVEVAPLGRQLFYETHGFTADDAALLFSAGDPQTASLDIYTYDLSTATLRNLTNTLEEYDEHAHFTPDGTRIVWASSRNITIHRDYFIPYTDYWSMNLDGTNQTRLTFFNDPNSSQYYQGGVVVGDLSFGPEGWFAAKLEVLSTSLGGIVEVVVMMR